MTAAESFGIELKSSVMNPIHLEYKIPFKLRDYQVKPVVELLQKPYGLLYAYVAFGKTAVTGEIIRRI